jgi:hypothetical protein
MKILFLILFLLPFVAFSQQIVDKKQIQKNQIQTEPNITSDSKVIDVEAYRKTNNVPEDFPRYIDTGNPKIDETNYHNAKQEWIRSNPDRFEKIKHLAL